MDISMLASNLALPREGNLELVFHVFSYLWSKHNSRLALDPTYPDKDHDIFKKHRWVDLYGDVKEAIRTDMPELRCKRVNLRMRVDSYHAGEKTETSVKDWVTYLHEHNFDPVYIQEAT